MDKVTLDKEQLKELRRFINSRGFHEPAVVMEVLDHFACLVEERIQADERIILEEAMKQAHASFGVFGFSKIAEAAKKEQGAYLRKAIKKHLKSMLSAPAYWLLIALTGLVYYKVYMLVLPLETGLFSGKYLLSWTYVVGMLIYFAASYKYYVRRKKLKEENYPYHSDDKYHWWLFILIVAFPDYPGNDLPVWPFALGSSVLISALLVYFIAHHRSLIDTTRKYGHIDDMYKALDE